MEALHNELASLIRVRNRLAQSPDASLPKILTGLLPKLVEHLDRNSSALDELRKQQINDRDNAEEEEELSLHTKVQEQISGIWMASIDRIRGGGVSTAPWMTPILSKFHDEEKQYTDVATAFMLSLLQASLPYYTSPGEEGGQSQDASRQGQQLHYLSILPALGTLVDSLHHSLVASSTTQNHNRQNNHQGGVEHNTSSDCGSKEVNFRRASWLCLDVLALSWGLPVLKDWDKDHFDEYAWKTPSPFSLSVECNQTFVPVWLGNPGMFHLSLDLVLFCTEYAEVDGADRELMLRLLPNSGQIGISPAGVARLNHRLHQSRITQQQGRRRNMARDMNNARAARRGLVVNANRVVNAPHHQSWNASYLRELKLACVNQIVEPLRTRKQCCDSVNELYVKRALLQCILIGSPHSLHGKFALEWLNKSRYYWDNGGHVATVKPSSILNGKTKKMSAAKATGRNEQQSVASTNKCPYDTITFACSLMVLVLGDRVSLPILAQHGEERARIETILGPIQAFTPPDERPMMEENDQDTMEEDDTHPNNQQNEEEQRSQTPFQRAPMPFGSAERAVDFILTELLPQRSSDLPAGFVDLKGVAGRISMNLNTREEGTGTGLSLFVELVNALKEQRGDVGAYWAIQITDGILSQLQTLAAGSCSAVDGDEDTVAATSSSSFVDTLYKSSLGIACTVLSQVTQVGEIEGSTRDDEVRPFDRRGDLNVLIRDPSRRRNIGRACSPWQPRFSGLVIHPRKGTPAALVVMDLVDYHPSDQWRSLVCLGNAGGTLRK